MTVTRAMAAMAALVVAAPAAAAAQSLEPEWSRPIGGATRFVGVEEYGRCSVFVDNSRIQVVAPAGDVMWTWSFGRISRYINPRKVAVSHACDAIAFVGDASYKYVWVVDRDGKSASIKFAATPADVAFDRTGRRVAIGTFAGSVHLYSTVGELIWRRETAAAIVGDLHFTDDNQRIVFKGWGGAGVVSAAGQVEWSELANRLAASRDLNLFVFSSEPNHGPGLPSIVVTDRDRKRSWHRWAAVDAFVSADGARVLALVDRVQQKKEEHVFGAPGGGADTQLLSANGEVIATFPDYRYPIALSEDGARLWLRSVDGAECVSEHGEILASIKAVTGYRGFIVSRDFAQVMVQSEKDLKPVAVERYAIPAPCRP